MKKIIFSMFLLLSFLMFAQNPIFAQVSLNVSKRASSKWKLAVADMGQPASAQNPSLAQELDAVLKNDLQFSGHFVLIGGGNVGAPPYEFIKLKQRGAEFVTFNEFQVKGNRLEIESQVFNVETHQQLLNKKFEANQEQKKQLMHQISDAIIEAVTGIPGLGSSRIAFVSNHSGTKQIYVVDWDGRNLVQLTQGENISIYPKWAPSEPKILCTDYTNRLPHIFVLDLLKKTKKPLSSRPGLNAFARYSPDGKKIVLTLSLDGNPEIYTCSADGSSLRRLTRSQHVESSPCWTPDGKKIIFVSDQSGTPQIYWMNSDGSGVERLTFRGSYNTSPDVSPNGDLIAYCSNVNGKFQLFVLDLKTKDAVQITRDNRSNEDPAWGPSNRHLAYSATQNYETDIYLIDIYEGNPIRLTKGLKDCSSPSWSPSYSFSSALY